jgi:hypothetical protein
VPLAWRTKSIASWNDMIDMCRDVLWIMICAVELRGLMHALNSVVIEWVVAKTSF